MRLRDSIRLSLYDLFVFGQASVGKALSFLRCAKNLTRGLADLAVTKYKVKNHEYGRFGTKPACDTSANHKLTMASMKQRLVGPAASHLELKKNSGKRTMADDAIR